MKLPEVRGRYTPNADLSKTNWFRVGGCAEMLFKPADFDDLVYFLANKPANCPITVLGVGSNIIIRDGGIDGVVIKLGREFAGVTLAHPVLDTGSHEIPHQVRDMQVVEVGAAALDLNVALFAADNGISGLEFLSGIPGTIGGAVKMNAGAYGKEIKDVLVEATLLDMNGIARTLSCKELDFSYRKCGYMNGADYIVTHAVLRGEAGNREEILERINKIKAEREETQPVRSRTGGSTFKNPDGQKAWQLIDAAGLRGYSIGGAQVSEKHCNFFINTGTATAKDLEDLILYVQAKVLAHSGITLQPEIKIIGKC